MTAETGWTSRVGVLDEAFAVIIGRVDGPGVVRFQSNLARRELPHCSAIGKALLGLASGALVLIATGGGMIAVARRAES